MGKREDWIMADILNLEDVIAEIRASATTMNRVLTHIKKGRYADAEEATDGLDRSYKEMIPHGLWMLIFGASDESEFRPL